MKVVQLFELYNFHVGHFSRFQLGIQIGKGDIFWKSVFSNYFEFCIETSKSQSTKVVHLDKIYNFAFELIPKFSLVFK